MSAVVRWRRLRAIGLAVVVLVLAAVESPAQETGSISGRVHDEQTAEALSIVQVHIPALGMGTLTNLDGRFMLRNVPVGTHEVVVELLGYATKTITGVVVEAGESTSMNVTLPKQAIELEALTVAIELERGNATQLLDERRTAPAVLDAIGSQDIARTPDSNAADVATRVTGVTVAEGKYVHVRGMNERYSQTALNGSPLPSPEPEKEVVPLDLFPSEFLETLTTQKTYTPDLPADFSGGVVQIETKEFFDRPFLRVGFSMGGNSMSQFGASNFLRYDGGSRDFLGVDDGTRALPTFFDGGLTGDRLPNEEQARQAAGLEFPREFTPRRGNAPVNFGLDLAAGTQASLFGRELGLLFGFTYDQHWAIQDTESESKWRASAFDPSLERLSPNVSYSFLRGTRHINWGAILNFNYMLSPSHKIGLQTMMNRVADDEARQYFGENREDIGPGVVANDRLRFISRQLLWGQISGEHRIFFGSRLEWRAALAQASRDEPGLREALYLRGFVPEDTIELLPRDSMPLFLEQRGESGRYFYSELTDDDVNAELSWQLPFGIWSDLRASLKVGTQMRNRDRDFAARRFNWQFLGGYVQNIDEALVDSTIVGQVDGPFTFAIKEFVQPGDQYVVDDKRRAGYAMIELPFTSWLRAVAGTRYEQYDLELISRDSTLAELSQNDWLPSLNLIWSPSSQINVRAAVSRTLDRPEFRELAPFQFTEVTSLRELVGNPDLEIAEVRNYDLRWDWFTRPGEVLSVSLFAKELERPIEEVFLAAASAAYSYQNAQDGYVRGVEFDVRQRLDRIGLSNFTFMGNLALTRSRVNVIEQGAFVPTNTQRPLVGQSPWVLNLGMLYTHTRGGTEIALFYNAHGDRIATAGGSGVPDIYQKSRNQLDLTLRRTLVGGSSMKLKVANILNEPYEFTQSANGVTLPQRWYKRGVSYSLAVSYDF